MSLNKNLKVLEDVVFVFFTYNQEKYLSSTLPSAFNQTCFPSKLIIMDDASTDNSDAVIKEILLDAPEDLKIEYQHNKKNIGLLAQINKLVNQFESKLIVVQAGDDESYPQRLEVTYNEWIQRGRPSLVLANHDDIDEEGEIIKAFASKKAHNKPYTLKRIINRRVMVYGCCAAFDSNMLNFFGPINTSVINEDRVNVFRAYFSKGIHYINQPLIKYRSQVGISAHKVNTREERINRVVLEAKRELDDLNCHLADLKKIQCCGVSKKLRARKKSVEWLVKITPRLGLFDVFVAICRGVSSTVALKTFKKVNKGKSLFFELP